MLMPTSSPNDANTQQDALLDPFGAAVTVRGEDADTQPIEAFPDDERMSPAVL